MKINPATDPGARCIRSFLDLSVGDMDRMLVHLRKLRDEAHQQHNDMMRRELKRMGVEFAKATGVKKARAKPGAKYRSKKDRKLTWSGRGSVPRWMRDEMKASKLKPSNFLV